MKVTYESEYRWLRVWVHGQYDTRRLLSIRLWPLDILLTWVPVRANGAWSQEAAPLRPSSLWHWLTLARSNREKRAQ